MVQQREKDLVAEAAKTLDVAIKKQKKVIKRVVKQAAAQSRRYRAKRLYSPYYIVDDKGSR